MVGHPRAGVVEGREVVDDDILSEKGLGRFAELVAAVGVAGVLTLILLYAVEAPSGGPYVFGTINDVLGGVYNLAVIPLVLHLSRDRARTAAWRFLTLAAVLASALGALSSSLLVANALDFTPSTIASLLALCVQSAWLLGFGLSDGARYSPGLHRLARFAGAGTLVGLPLVGLGFLLPSGSAPQLGLFVLGGAVGGSAWLTIPFLWHVVGAQLRSAGAPRR
jgi:hypothetical protein